MPATGKRASYNKTAAMASPFRPPQMEGGQAVLGVAIARPRSVDFVGPRPNKRIRTEQQGGLTGPLKPRGRG
jgi:hypothetical protein